MASVYNIFSTSGGEGGTGPQGPQGPAGPPGPPGEDGLGTSPLEFMVDGEGALLPGFLSRVGPFGVTQSVFDSLTPEQREAAIWAIIDDPAPDLGQPVIVATSGLASNVAFAEATGIDTEGFSVGDGLTIIVAARRSSAVPTNDVVVSGNLSVDSGVEAPELAEVSASEAERDCLIEVYHGVVTEVSEGTFDISVDTGGSDNWQYGFVAIRTPGGGQIVGGGISGTPGVRSGSIGLTYNSEVTPDAGDAVITFYGSLSDPRPVTLDPTPDDTEVSNSGANITLVVGGYLGLEDEEDPTFAFSGTGSGGSGDAMVIGGIILRAVAP